MVHSQGGRDEAPKEESDQEVVANNLDAQPLVFRLCAEEDIGENCPEKKLINIKQSLV